MKPNRIVAFYQNVPPFPGAVSLRAHSIASGLKEAFCDSQYELEIFTTTEFAANLSCFEISIFPAKGGANTSGLASRMLSELFLAIKMSLRLLDDRKRIKLLIISSPSYICAIILAILAKLLRLRYVLEVRDLYPEVFVEAGLLANRSLIYRLLTACSKSIYQSSASVVALTHGLAAKISDLAPASTVNVIYNGFPGDFIQKQAAVSKHLTFTVCFHGILGFFQDSEMLVRLIRELSIRGVDTVVIGYGKDEAAFRELHVSGYRFLGKLAFSQTIEEVAKCHLGVCLRRDDEISKDSFPVKIWEYLGLGIPCVSTPISEAGEFLVANNCGFQFQSNDLSGVLSCIGRLRSDRLYYQQIANNCRLTSKHYTREAMGAKFASIISEIIDD